MTRSTDVLLTFLTLVHNTFKVIQPHSSLEEFLWDIKQVEVCQWEQGQHLHPWYTEAVALFGRISLGEFAGEWSQIQYLQSFTAINLRKYWNTGMPKIETKSASWWHILKTSICYSQSQLYPCWDRIYILFTQECNVFNFQHTIDQNCLMVFGYEAKRGSGTLDLFSCFLLWYER